MKREDFVPKFRNLGFCAQVSSWSTKTMIVSVLKWRQQAAANIPFGLVSPKISEPLTMQVFETVASLDEMTA